MAEKNVYYAKNISDVLYHLKNVANLKICAGCTALALGQEGRAIDFGEDVLTIRNIPELGQITKTERFIEFGSAATLARILALDPKKIPTVLRSAILSIGNPYTANLATIGGNICASPHKMTCHAPLLALDAKIVLLDQTGETSVPLSKFTEIPAGSFVTKIRVPIEDWDMEIFKRIGDGISEESASFSFLINTQKDIIYDVRVAFSGPFSFRSRELENILIGSKLPLSPKNVSSFFENARRYFYSCCEKNHAGGTPLVQAQFINMLTEAVNNFA